MIARHGPQIHLRSDESYLPDDPEWYVIRNADGEEWTDPGYEIEGRLPHLDQGLEQEYLHTVVWRQD
jgi:hypothetical protein